MLEAAFWGFVGGASLLIGAGLGLWFSIPQRAIGLIMGFGSGVLISALAFELAEGAFEVGGADAVTLGLALGAVSFFGANTVLNRRGGRDRKRSDGQQATGSSTAILIGAVMDGIPESAAIGLTLLGGGEVGAAVVVAVFLSNLPEAISAATGMRKAGHEPRYVLGVWALVAAASALAAGLGYELLGGASGNVVAGTQAFAAGAVLTMLADTMMPEGFKHGGDLVGLVTVLGFTAAFLLSHV